MIGFEVAKQSIDSKAGETALAFRQAFVTADIMRTFLNNNPVVTGVDPLVTEFGYTEDEATFIRGVFANIELMQDDYAALLNDLTKFTALG